MCFEVTNLLLQLHLSEANELIVSIKKNPGVIKMFHRALQIFLSSNQTL